MKRIQVTIILMAFAFIAGLKAYAAVEINGIAYNISESGATVTSKSSGKYTGSITIPATITYDGKTYKVTSIGTYAFKGCTSLTSITIPNSVTSIGFSAFSECISLTGINIPNSVTKINSSTFHGCTSLTSINIPNSVNIIAGGAFNYCTSLTSINIPNSVTNIGSTALSNTAWYNNQPDGLIYAGKVTYKYKGNMPANTSITLKEGTLGIAGSAFEGCANLTGINIPNSVINIGSSALSNTAWYNNQPDGLIYAGKVAYKYKGNMPANMSITLKEGTLGIAGSAFQDCTSLTSIIIPNSVTNIGASAFYGCTSLTNIVIPNSTKEIWESAFSGTTSPTDVYCYAATPPTILTNGLTLNRLIFPSTCNVHIPIGTLSAYQNAYRWSDITNFIEDLSSTNTYEPIEGSGDDLQDYLDSFADQPDILTQTSYTRQFLNTDWQSLYVPFSLSYNDWNADFEIAQLKRLNSYDDNSDGTVDRQELVATVMTATDGDLQANHPYLIRAKQKGTYTLYPGAARMVTQNAYITVYDTGISVTGNYTDHKGMKSARQYRLAGGSLWIPNSDDDVLKPFRWYANFKKERTSFVIMRIISGTTSVTYPVTMFGGDELVGQRQVYDLSGRRVHVSENTRLSSLPKSVYLIDGRKVIVK